MLRFPRPPETYSCATELPCVPATGCDEVVGIRGQRGEPCLQSVCVRLVEGCDEALDAGRVRRVDLSYAKHAVLRVYGCTAGQLCSSKESSPDRCEEHDGSVEGWS